MKKEKKHADQNESKNHISSKVKALIGLRHKRGMTQVDLAKATGYSPAYISLIESGQRELSPKFAFHIAKVFNLPIETFLSGHKDHQHLLNHINRQLLALDGQKLKSVITYIKCLKNIEN